MRPSVLASAFLVATLAAVPSLGATGQAILLDLGGGQLVGIVLTDTGQVIVVTSVQVIRLEPTPAVASAILLYESSTQNQKLGQIVSKIRQIPELSRKLPVLDKDSRTEDDLPLPLVVRALEGFDGELPCLIGFGPGGEPVVDVPLPDSVEGIASQLEEWGL